MFEIDFSMIRNHDGSQDKGFEELICQLAHLDTPENAKSFVRKEGDGGDAGVECYWILNDGSEYAWQAKYFLDVITDAQWRQINKSVETALEKHPNITRYYVCLPRDWTDSRKIIGETKTKGSLDKWNEHVEVWEEIARSKGMDVEFVYWCKHEIIQMLQVDRPEYSGRILYWFNEPFICSDVLRTIAKKSKESLGERFTPEFHVELPIAYKFDCVGMTPQWIKKLEKEVVQLGDSRNALKKFLNSCDSLLKNEERSKLNEEVEKFHSILLESVQNGMVLDSIETLRMLCSEIKDNINIILDDIFNHITNEESEGVKKKYREKSYDLRRIADQFEEIYDFLMDEAINAGKMRAILLLGEAGIGKSHLLCDITFKRLNEDLPTVFVLGQHYTGGSPFDFISSKLGLPNYSYRTVLGALDALGESKKSRTLIVVDAINEGVHRDAWYDNIVDFFDEIRDFPNVAVVLSCRNTYKEYLMPKEILGSKVIEINHHGFRGYEHRAALNYLAKQGISKLGIPVLMPEFSNPLFLKTCCKAIKSIGKNQFPKGLNGFNKLYEFYINSVNEVIRIKKRYRTNRSIVLQSVKRFVAELYPNNLYGVDADFARELINEFDLNPNVGESLFDLLIDEGIIAFDIISEEQNGTRGIEIVRFSYERFSDYAIAEHILGECTSESDVTELFKQEGEIGKLLIDQEWYKYGGIIEALGMIIPEKLQKEFLEFVDIDKDDEEYKYRWLFEKTFADTILWRTGESISEKSLELLNDIESIGYENKMFDVLLSLSTEPDHPWNADFLDENLRRWEMSYRDSIWSTYVAINDNSEEEFGEESIIRTLIEWSANAEMKDVEPERLRLTAVSLLWMTTTSNRKVRDQATKSFARVIYQIPEKIIWFIENFNRCDDVYVVERLYAAIYGALVKIKDNSVIRGIAECIYNCQFKEGRPYPDILLRDYVRGILEFAYSKNLINENVTPESFRPPYKSEWPIENPSKEVIDNLTGDKYTSSIKSSLMGFPGDFGNYTMGCVHNWSATPISADNHKTGLELMKDFVKKLLPELRIKYESYLESQVQELRTKTSKDIKEWLKKLTDQELDKLIEDIKNEDEEDPAMSWHNLKEEIENSLNEEDKEEFRWINGLSINGRPGAFSRKWGQRWVCKKAYDLGWKSDSFSGFERMYSNGGGYGRQGGKIERIGKKYQWIAFHELLARMSDNLMWIDRGYSDLDDHKYFGPWQVHKRDIDPSLWIKKTGTSGWESWDKEFWWQPYIFPFVDDNLEEQRQWLWDQSIVPPFEKLLTVTNPEDNNEWIVLRGFSDWKKNPLDDAETIPYQNGWYRINSCIIYKKDFEELKENIQNKPLCDPHTVYVPGTGHQGYFGEYPWHPYYNNFEDWRSDEEPWRNIVSVMYHVPISKYEWETGNVDYSIDESISFYMPSPMLIRELSLIKSDDNIGEWINEVGDRIFIDPSVTNIGPSYGLIRRDVFTSWLEKNDLMIVWLIGGEKQLFTSMANKFYGRLVYSGVFSIVDNEVKGDLWFNEEKPQFR